MRTRLLALAAATSLVLGVTAAAVTTAAASPAAKTRPAATRPAATARCGTLAQAPRYTHVIWIWMENQSYNTIIGSSQAPYINSVANRCGLATNYHNITHPSLPNYVGATSGLGYAALAPFTPDCNPVPGCTTSAPSIFGQGESWKAYQEVMPSNCDKSNSGEYAVRHNPPPYFTTLGGCGTFDVHYAQLATDLANNTLPAFSFVTPDLIDDMHDGTVAQGDAWLANKLPAILNSSEYQSGTTAVFITWDEGEGGTATQCANNTTDVGCHVATLVVSPSTKAGTKSATLFNHYSLLATAEQLLGLNKLGLAASATSMVSAFNL